MNATEQVVNSIEQNNINTAEANTRPMLEIVAASKDVSSRGRIHWWWYRMRWTGESWSYFARQKLPMGGWSSAMRRTSVPGSVYVGDIVLQHDYRGPVTGVYVVQPDGQLQPLKWIASPDNQSLIITLPNGDNLQTPNPRKP